jgi:Protein of unknown function with HXXEE motif
MTKTTAISLGLFAAWAAHDAEEWLTFSGQSAEMMKRAPSWVPLPEDLRRTGITQAHFETSLMVMAGLMAAAAVAGARTGGRSRLFQWTLDAYGLHGIGHIASAVLLRRYTSGSATSPLVVIPFWLWARRALAAEGVPLREVKPLSVLPLVPILWVALAIGYVATRDPEIGTAEAF